MDSVLKLDEDWSLPEDVKIFEKKIGENVTLECFYDAIMEAFIVRIYKSNEETGIGLRVGTLQNMLRLFPRINMILSRYSNRDMYMCYRFEIAELLYVSIGKRNVSNIFYRGFRCRCHLMLGDLINAKIIHTLSGIISR